MMIQTKLFVVFLSCSVELFFDSCGEMNAWMQEKDAVLSDEDLGRDLETVRALQRRHQVTLCIKSCAVTTSQ